MRMLASTFQWQTPPGNLGIMLCADQQPRDLSSIVGGLHGGKYQFGMGGAQSFSGAQFASSLASSRASEFAIDGQEDTENCPMWASTLVPDLSELAGHIVFQKVDEVLEVHVTNTFRTWEPWVSAVVDASGRESDLFRITSSPLRGTMAPRGGAKNVCDETKPYSDSVSVAVQCSRHAFESGEASGYLVIKTEEAQWSYALTID